MRLKIFVAADETYTNDNIEFEIENFPARPQKDDLIDLKVFFPKAGFTEGQEKLIYDFSYTVEIVFWGKDEKGIYMRVFCVGQ